MNDQNPTAESAPGDQAQAGAETIASAFESTNYYFDKATGLRGAGDP